MHAHGLFEFQKKNILCTQQRAITPGARASFNRKKLSHFFIGGETCGRKREKIYRLSRLWACNFLLITASNSPCKTTIIPKRVKCVLIFSVAKDFYSIFTRLFIIIDKHVVCALYTYEQAKWDGGTCLISLNGNLNVNVTPVECHFHILHGDLTASERRTDWANLHLKNFSAKYLSHASDIVAPWRVEMCVTRIASNTSNVWKNI